MRISRGILVVFITVALVMASSAAFADIASPDGKVGVRMSGGQTIVYDTATGQSYGSIAGGTGAQFSSDSQSVVIKNAKVDSFGTVSDYKIYCRH